MRLPIYLLASISVFLLLVRAQQQLSLDTFVDLDSSKLPSPPSFRLPADTSSPLYVSVALCASSSSPPRFFVTNDTTFTQPGPGDVDDVSVFEVIVGPEGFGSWAGTLTNGGILAVQKGSTTTPFEVVVSATSTSLHALSTYQQLTHPRRNLRRGLPICRRHDLQPSTHILSCVFPSTHRRTELSKLHPPLSKPLCPRAALKSLQLLPRLCEYVLRRSPVSPADNVCHPRCR